MMEVNITGQSKPVEVTCVAEVKPLDILGVSSSSGDNNGAGETLTAFGVCDDEEEQDKLCGWLSVRPNTRLLPKINKQRYFVFSDKTCKLYHYRSQHDMLPLGEIDIYNASFNFEASNLDKPGLFEIRSEGKIYSLDASNRVNMMYWLQALQKKRRKYSETRASKDPVRQDCENQDPLSKKSLLALSGESDGTASTSESQSSAQTPASNQRTRFWSLAALQSEILNILNSHKQQRAPANSCKNDEWLMVDNIGDIPTVTVTDASKPFEPTKSFDSAKSSESLKSGDTVKSSETPKTPDATRSQDSDKTPDSPKLVETPTKLPDSPKQGEGSKMDTAKSRTAEKGKGPFKWKLKKTPKCNESPTAGGYSCEKCRQFEQESMTLKDDLSSIEEELEASRVVVSFLQKEIDQLQRQLNTRSELERDDKKDVEDMLKVRDDNIVKLEHLLAMTKEEKETQVQSTQKIKNENEALHQTVKKLQDEIKDKEQQLKQTEEQRKGSSHSQWYDEDGTQTKVITDNFKKLEILNDMVHAYEMQNKFLSIEILELNELRQQSEKREKLLSMELARQEAKYYKIMSKYLIILENLKKATQGESGQKPEVVKQLLEEVLDSELNFKGDFAYSQANSPEYDVYGFPRHIPSKDGDLLSVRAGEMQRKSEELNANIKDIDEKILQQNKWDNFMTGLDKRELQRSSELKALIRSGVPYEHKERIWIGCINFYVGHRRKHLEPEHYQNLVAQVMNQKPNPEAKQIELDLLRTLPNNKYYMSLESEKIQKLRRVLLAFSWQCSSVGYCQGLNRLAAVALLFLNEEDAFWCLVTIVEYLLPQDYYSSSMVAAQTDQRVLKDLVQEKLPRLHAYLEKESIDLSLFTFNWFLTIFVDNVPPETFLRIWDAFLYEGSKVLFRFAVAFFKVAEDEIVSQKNNMAVNKYLQALGEKMVNLNQIVQIAFHWLNPFPMRSIASKRQFYLTQVKAELAQLDALREAYRESQAVAKQKQKEQEEEAAAAEAAAAELKPEEKSSEIVNSEDDD